MTKVRQWWVPAEFRLPEPEFTKEQLDLLEELIQMIAPNLSRFESASRDGRVQMANFLVDLGTGIWRVRRKIDGLSRMPKEIYDALYSIESMWASMSEGGVEIIDHIGTLPSPREAKVVETKEVPGLTREQVVDALKPTILLRGEVVQVGEVVVGKPAVAPAPPSPQIAPPVFGARRDETDADELTQMEDDAPVAAMPAGRYSDGGAGENAEAVSAAPLDDQALNEPDPGDEPEELAEARIDDAQDEAPRANEQAAWTAPPGDETRLDSETAIEAEALDAKMEEPDPEDAGRHEAIAAMPETPVEENIDLGAEGGEPESDQRMEPVTIEAEPDKSEPGEPEPNESEASDPEPTEPEIEIPLPRRAPRRGRTVRDAVKQVISEEAGADAASGAGRAKRRRARAESAEKAEDAKPPERKKRSPRRKEEA
jgi:hypothetical protein